MNNTKKEEDYKKVIEVLKKPSKTDPMGSYTGVRADEYEKPTQDADDL